MARIVRIVNPLALRGCGSFRIIAGKLAFQHGYWNKLSFLKAHGRFRTRQLTGAKICAYNRTLLSLGMPR